MGRPWFSMAHFPWSSPEKQGQLAGGPDRHRPRGDPANSPEDGQNCGGYLPKQCEKADINVEFHVDISFGVFDYIVWLCVIDV